MNDKEHLASLTKNQKRYLSRFECGWCDHPLNRPGCSAMYGLCSDADRIKRRKECLQEYKPRNKRNIQA